MGDRIVAGCRSTNLQMSDIFISYAREDEPRAQALAQTLAERGWSIFCEKTAQNYGSLVALALGFILIKSVHTA
jgi:hypothetical protein